MIRRCLVALLLAVLFACSRKARDPWSKAAIEEDLDRRTVQNLYDEAEKLKFEPPEDRLITEKQIIDFVQRNKLARQIREVTQHRAGEQSDRAAAAEDRFSRMGEAFAAIGTVRSYATADLRASLSLGMNPREQQWVQNQIAVTLPLIERIQHFEGVIAEKKSELDAEIDPFLQTRLRESYDQAVRAKEQWEASEDPTELENARTVMAHSFALRNDVRFR
jgi:hypothetical protein